MESCGSSDADEYPGGQIVLRSAKVISKSCNISNGKARLAAMCLYPFDKDKCSASFLIEYNNTSFNPESPDGYYALKINGVGESNIRFDHCSIIYNIAYYVICCQLFATSYFDNCTFINPAAHTLFMVQDDAAYIYASNCYANHYTESTLIKSNGNISLENMSYLESIRIAQIARVIPKLDTIELKGNNTLNFWLLQLFHDPLPRYLKYHLSPEKHP